MENLNVRIEKDSEGGWLAVLPPHPDMPDEEFGLPAETKEEAEAEARAYRAIEQSSLYKFDFDEAEGNYVVKLGQEEYRAPLLADAYAQAQAAYAKRINEESPKAEEPAPAPASKRTRARPGNSKPGNGETPKLEPTPPKVTAPAPKPEPTPLPKLDIDQKVRLDKLEAILVVMARTILKEIKGE
jgi:predicted RNase H-like HicB family nuclease